MSAPRPSIACIAQDAVQTWRQINPWVLEPGFSALRRQQTELMTAYLRLEVMTGGPEFEVSCHATSSSFWLMQVFGQLCGAIAFFS